MTRWKVSAAWLAGPHECNLAGIHARCGGACCWSGPGGTYWPARSFADEQETGPRGNACGHLGSEGCTLSDADKPVTCHLYPLVLNASGTLVKHQRTVFSRGICKGNHGQGPPLIEAIADNLSVLFGAEQVARVREDVLAGRDSYFDVPEAVAAAWEDEKARAAANERPRMRSEPLPDPTIQKEEPVSEPESPQTAEILPRRSEVVPIASIKPHPRNAKRGDVAEIRASIRAHGFYGDVLVQASSREIMVGEHRWRAAQDEGLQEIPVELYDVDDRLADRIRLADNRTAELGTWDDPLLAELLAEHQADEGLEGLGWSDADLESLLRGSEREQKAARISEARRTLAERFGVPPFSVLDARQGYWKDRKAAWLALGIRSERGRGENLIGRSLEERLAATPGSPSHYEQVREVAAAMKADPDSPEAQIAERLGFTDRRNFGGIPAGPAIESRMEKGPGTYEGAEGIKERLGWAGQGREMGGRPARQARIGDYYERLRKGEKPEEILGEIDSELRRVREALLAGRHVQSKLGGVPSDKFNIPGYYRKREEGWSDEQIVDEFLASGTTMTGGTSVFDPVLCELVYRWFCPAGGRVLDPFAGGSVRGIVAATLGLDYTGIDLSPEQVQANEDQWRAIQGEGDVANNTPKRTPVEEHGGVLVKREDLFAIAGVRGGKVRTCWALAQEAYQKGAKGLVTAGSRSSPQVNIVAHIARQLGLGFRAHVPSGKLTPELEAARRAGAEIVQHSPGYNNVIVARARTDAEERGWTEIPFGMETSEAVRQTGAQVDNLPRTIKRIVVPVGSGMSLAGILEGLRIDERSTPVLGVVVGADPSKRLDRFAEGWRDRVELVEAGLPYDRPASETRLGDLLLDPIYEAKCLRFLREGDLLWDVGIRQTADPSAGLASGASGDVRWALGDAQEMGGLVSNEFDLVFSCPPYYDLERYSDDPGDLSNFPSYEEFRDAYADIVRQAVVRLRPERFACFVVSQIRDSKGFHRRFVSDTIDAFEEAGARLYNEAVLIQSIGTLPVRAAGIFKAGRKLGRSHQSVLVFFKGDPKRIRETFGDPEFGEPPAEEAQDPEE